MNYKLYDPKIVEKYYKPLVYTFWQKLGYVIEGATVILLWGVVGIVVILVRAKLLGEI